MTTKPFPQREYRTKPVHLIQFDSGRDSFAYWPESDRDRDSGLRHLRNIGAPDFIVRSQIVTVDKDGNLHHKWRTIESRGRYSAYEERKEKKAAARRATSAP